MTSLTFTQLGARTGPPRDNDWIGYVWMAVFAVLMLAGYSALLPPGGI